MGLFNKFSSLFNSEGVRKAMRKSYEQHVQKIANGVIPVPDGTTAHQAALYGALGSRYKARWKPFNEVAIWAELIPFMLMREEDAIGALIEYVVYQELPGEANILWLSEMINDVLRKPYSSEDSPRAMAPMAVTNRVAWYLLLDSDVKNKIDKETEGFVNAFIDEEKDFNEEQNSTIYCINCGQALRIPAGKTLKVTCKQCDYVFDYSP